MNQQPRSPTGPKPGGGGGGGEPPAQADPELLARLSAATREFSCRELGELTGMSHETARRYLDGRSPGIVFITRLCEALSISADWLLLGRGSPVYHPDVPIGQMDTPVDEVLDTLGNRLRRLHDDVARGDAGPARQTLDEDFVDPFAEEGAALRALIPVPLPLAAPMPIRLVLGPANGQQLVVPHGTGSEIMVALGQDGKARVADAAAGDAGAQRYRRVSLRVYRWVRSGEFDESTEAGRGV